VITRLELRQLARQTGSPAISSVYLDVDGRYRPARATVELAFESMAQSLRLAANGDDLLLRSIEGDLHAMRTWLAHDLNRSSTRGLAMFACSSRDWFQAVPLPLPVQDAATLGPRPRLVELATLLQGQKRTLVGLVDRRRLRVFRVELRHVEEVAGVSALELRGIDTTVDMGDFHRHNDELARSHFRRTANHLDQALADWPADRLIVGGPGNAATELERYLSTPARALVAGRVNVGVSGPIGEISAAIAVAEDAIEQGTERDTVRDLREHAATGRGVLGLGPTLDALDQGRVAMLVVSAGLTAPGMRCPKCDHLSPSETQCGRCGTPTTKMDDIIELVVGQALADDTEIRFCRVEDLDRVGRIGAVERY